MTTLLNNKETDLTGGNYAYTADITTGTITLSIKIGNADFVDVTDGVLSATGTGVISLPRCKIKAVYSGDAAYSLGVI